MSTVNNILRAKFAARDTSAMDSVTASLEWIAASVPLL